MSAVPPGALMALVLLLMSELSSSPPSLLFNSRISSTSFNADVDVDTVLNCGLVKCVSQWDR